MTTQGNSISVLHVATALSWRGGEQQVAYLLTELEKKNIRQMILCSEGSAMEKYCIKNNFQYVTSKRGWAFDFTYAKNVSDICKKNQISIIHVHDSHAHTFAIMAAVFFPCKAGIIVSRRVDFEIGRNLLSTFKYNHNSIKKILCVSEAIRNIASKAVKDTSKLVTVHSGVDLSRFNHANGKSILHEQYSLTPQTRIIANIAAIAPHKDYKTFVDTVAVLSRKFTEIIFMIIGDGPDKAEIENYIKVKKLEKIILMTGFRNDIADIFPEIDVMLITSETEGLGTSILDAFASQVAVVATAAGGIPEIVIHEKTGLLAPVKDFLTLAANVERILTDQQLRDKLVKNATDHLKNFTTTHTASKTLEQYYAVAGCTL